MHSTTIANVCAALKSMKTRGTLGQAISDIVLLYSPRDLQQMRANFSGAIKDISPEYLRDLEEAITAHLHGTYQALRLMNQQGSTPAWRKPSPRTRRNTGQ